MTKLSESSDPPLGIILLVIFVIGLIGAVTVSFLYYWYFSGQQIVIDPAAWGQLGDYFGGVLNPVFGFLSLLGLLFTIFFNQKELRLSREEVSKATRATEKQTEHLKRESEKSELLKVVEQIHSELRECLERKCIWDIETGQEHNADGTTIHYEYIYAGLLARPPHGIATLIPDKTSVAAIPFHAIGGRLMELQQYLAEYERTAESLTVPDFYRRRYSDIATTLLTYEFIDRPCKLFFTLRKNL